MSALKLSAFCCDLFGGPSKPFYQEDNVSTPDKTKDPCYKQENASRMMRDLNVFIKDKFAEISPKALIPETKVDCDDLAQWEVLPEKNESDAEEWEVLPKEKNKVGDSDEGKSLLIRLNHPSGNVLGVSFNCQYVDIFACGGYGEKLSLYHLDRHMTTYLMIGDGSKQVQSQITSLEWHPRYPAIIATASDAAIAQVWDIRTDNKKAIYGCDQENGECTKVLRNPNRSTEFAVSSKGVQGSDSVKIWDIRNQFGPLSKFGKKEVLSMSWCSNENLILTTNVDEEIDCWKLNGVEDTDPTKIIYKTPDQRRLLSGGSVNRDAVWCKDTVIAVSSKNIGMFKVDFP